MTTANKQQWIDAIYGATKVATQVERFPKASVSRSEMEKTQKSRLEQGAKSSVLNEDATNWILTTAWPGG